MKDYMKLSTTTMVLGGLGAAALLYMIFKPKDAAAAPAPGPGPGPGPGPSGATQTCPGGQVILATATCPQVEPKDPVNKKCPDNSTIPFTSTCPTTASPCQAHSTVLNTAPVPDIVVTASGLGQPAKEILSPFGLSALPVSVVDNPCIESATDALIYLQAWTLDVFTGYKPIFTDGGPAPAVSIALTNAAGTGIAKAADEVMVMRHKDSYISDYFDPKLNSKLAEMEAPGSFVLIWSADPKGIPIAWWLTIWTMAVGS